MPSEFINALRQTGRTSRMIACAVQSVRGNNKKAFLVFLTLSDCLIADGLVKKLIKDAPDENELLSKIICVRYIDEEWDLKLGICKNADMVRNMEDPLIYIDHSVYEKEYGEMFERAFNYVDTIRIGISGVMR